MSRPVLIVAGEASGDLHAARLLTALRERVPDVEAFGMGGDELVAAGLDRIADSAEISVVGLVEVLKIYRRAKEIFARLLEEVERRRPVLAVLVDFPDFNLRLAKELEARGLEVVYYISPQVWAWRRGRVKTIARTVDEMLVLFPFEEDFYARHDVAVTHVGHPLVDEVPELPHAWDPVADGGGPDGEGPDRAAGPGRDEPFRVALLPGSRGSELDALLPTMLESVRRLGAELPVRARLIKAPTIPRQRLEAAVAAAGLPEDVPVEIVERDRFTAIADCHLALCASGTATLEVALLGTPMLVLYRLAAWTYLAARFLVRLPHVALVNLVLERRAVPELVQSAARPERVAAEAAALLGDRERVHRMRRALAAVRGRLGEGGASGRAADAVAARLQALPGDRSGGDGDPVPAGASEDPAPDGPARPARGAGVG